MAALYRWQQRGQRRRDRPVGPVGLRPFDLTPEHCDLVPEYLVAPLVREPEAATRRQRDHLDRHTTVTAALRPCLISHFLRYNH